MATSTAVRVGRAVWKTLKEAGRIAMPDNNPEDFKDAINKVHELVKILMGKGPADQHGGPSGAVREHPMEDLELFASIPVIDESRFKHVNKVKLFMALLAAGVICGVHHLDEAARHPIAKESGVGVGLFLAISAPAAVPAAPALLTKTTGMMPSEVARDPFVLAGPVCPGLLGHTSEVTYVLPHAISGANSSTPRFDPAGFMSVVLLPYLSALFEE